MYMSLPSDRDARNALPVWDGCIAYFPDCWAEIAKVSVMGNKQHALGEKLRFARDVSTDHANKIMRHMLDHAAGNVMDSDGTYHLAKAAWRALAALQVAIEAQNVAQSGNVPEGVNGYGQANRENTQCHSRQGFCPGGPTLPDRGQEPRQERFGESFGQWIACGESSGSGQGTQ